MQELSVDLLILLGMLNAWAIGFIMGLWLVEWGHANVKAGHVYCPMCDAKYRGEDPGDY